MTINLLIDNIDPIDGPKPNLYGIRTIPTGLSGQIKSSFLNADEKGWFYPVCVSSIYYASAFFNPPYLRELPPKVFKGLKENRGWILFSIFEPMSESMIEHIIVAIDSSKILKRVIILCLHNVNHPNFIQFNAHQGEKNYFHNSWDRVDESLVPKKDIPQSDVAHLPKKHFLLLLQTYYENPHRMLLVSLFEKAKLLDSSIVSVYNYAKDYNLALDRQYIYLDVPSKVSDSMSFTSNEKVYNNIDIKDGMNNSCVNIVAEGDYTLNNSLYFTDKTLRNFVHKKPFILVGQPGQLEYIKQQGYKTFSSLFDESYDLEHDITKRFTMIIRQIVNLSKMSISSLEKKIAELDDILEFNKNLYYENLSKVNSRLESLSDA